MPMLKSPKSAVNVDSLKVKKCKNNSGFGVLIARLAFQT